MLKYVPAYMDKTTIKASKSDCSACGKLTTRKLTSQI